MHELLVQELSALVQRARTALGALAGVVLGVCIEWAKWCDERLQRLHRRLQRLELAHSAARVQMQPLQLKDATTFEIDFSPALSGPYHLAVAFIGDGAVPGWKIDPALYRQDCCRVLLTGSFTGTVLWRAEVLPT